jgi:hypothetical protein
LGNETGVTEDVEKLNEFKKQKVRTTTGGWFTIKTRMEEVERDTFKVALRKTTDVGSLIGSC